MTPLRLLVTGSSSGIGRALAAEAASRGWILVLVGRDAARLSDVAADLAGTGHEVIVADLSTGDGVDAVASRLRDDLHPCYGIINAAGLGMSRPYPLGDIVDERRMLDVNVRAVLELSQVAAEIMCPRGAGIIVNVSSTASYWSAGTYAGSKAWVLMATQGLASQCRGSGVRVMALVPGFTRTEFHGRSGTDASGVRPWMWLSPDEVAVAAFECLQGGNEVCIPGMRYRILVGIVRHLSTNTRSRVLRWLAPLTPTAASSG